MLVMPPKERKRREREEYEKRQNQIMQGLLNNYDTETVISDNATVEDCIEAPLKEFKVRGKDIKQEVREGYNFIDISNLKNGTYHGVELINNDGLITLNGIPTTSGSDSFGRITFDKNKLTTLNGYYTLVVEISSGIIESGGVGVSFRDEEDNQLGYIQTSLTQKIVPKNFNIDNIKNIDFFATQNANFNNCQLRVMLLEGNYTAERILPYEAYGQSPSKDFSSPLEYVEGNQDVEHFNKNIFNENDFIDKLSKCCKVETEFVDDIECYKISRITEYRIDYPINFNKITTMQVIAKAEGNVELFIRDINGKKYSFPLNKTLSKKNLTIEGIKSIGVGLYEFNAYIYIAKNSIQLEEGTEETDYVSHQSETYPLDLINRNLLIYPYTDTSKELYGVKWIDNGDGSISAKGLAIQDSSFKLCGDINNQKTIKEKYLSGGKNSNEIVRMVTKQNNSYIILANSTGTSTPINLETYQEGYIEIVIKAGTEVNTTFYPMLSNFETDIYVPYQSESYQYSLYSKNDCIYYDEEQKKYFVHNEYDKYVVDGINNTVQYNFLGNVNHSAYINNLKNKVLIPKSNNDVIDIKSNRFLKESINNIINQKSASKVGVRMDGLIFLSFGENSELTTTELLNEYFVENNTEIVYPLAEPTDTKITSKILIEQLDKLRKIMTHKNINHFIVTSEIGQSANLKVIAYKDTFKILKEEIDNLKALVLEQEG